jgi:hypothetical protein
VAQLIHSPANVIADNIPYRMEESKHMTNPTMPPPHVLEALRKPTYLEEHPSNPVEEPCCQTWETAHLIGTDCEMISSLVGYAYRWPRSMVEATSPGWPTIGTDLPPVRYCPWCGHRKTKKRKQRRKAGRLGGS